MLTLTTHINKSQKLTHRKGEARRSNESLNDIYKTLRMVHPSESREQVEQVFEGDRQNAESC